MPLPFILGGAAALLGVTGAALAADGIENQGKAEKILGQAKNRFEASKAQLERQDLRLQDKLEYLGKIYLNIGQDFQNFQEIADELLQKLNQSSQRSLSIQLPANKVKQIEKVTINFNSLATSLAGGLTGGALAGAATYAGVMALGTASTGTAIASLSGAAASKATWAALGGGALKAGGLGVMGGMAMTAGLVAAPALAFMGWAYSDEAEKSLKKAQESLEEVVQFEEKTSLAMVQLADLGWYINDVIAGVNEVYKSFYGYYSHLVQAAEQVRNNTVDTLENQDEILQSIQNGYALAAILTDIITTPLFKLKNQAQDDLLITSTEVEKKTGLALALTDSQLWQYYQFYFDEARLEADSENEIEFLDEAEEKVAGFISQAYQYIDEQIQAIYRQRPAQVDRLVVSLEKELSALNTLLEPSSDLRLSLRQALLAPTPIQCGQIIKQMVADLQLAEGELAIELLALPVLVLVEKQRQQLQEGHLRSLEEAKLAYQENPNEKLAEHPEFLNLLATDPEGLEGYQEDLEVIFSRQQPTFVNEVAHKLPMSDTLILSSLGLKYTALKPKAAELSENIEAVKSELKTLLSDDLELQKTKLLLEHQERIRSIAFAEIDTEIDEENVDLEQMSQIGFRSLIHSLLTSENQEEFAELTELLDMYEEEFLEGESQESFIRSMLEIKNGLQTILEQQAQTAQVEIKKDLLAELDLPSVVAEHFADDGLAMADLANCQRVVQQHFEEFIDEILGDLTFQNAADESVEFAQENGIHLPNKEIMTARLEQAKASLELYN